MRKNETLFETTLKTGAEFSPCRKHRYQLWRIWDESKPLIAFIGLNPSTANEDDNDPTIRRVMGFAKAWGYGGVMMYNLFSIISADPKILLTCDDPIKNNDWYLDDLMRICKDVCFAWGNFKEATARSIEVAAKFPSAICLGINKNGTPKHPLYIKADTSPVNLK